MLTLQAYNQNAIRFTADHISCDVTSVIACDILSSFSFSCDQPSKARLKLKKVTYITRSITR